jgi:hypothetical protein
VVQNHKAAREIGRQPVSEAKAATSTRDAVSSTPDTVEGRSLATRSRTSNGGPDER